MLLLGCALKVDLQSTHGEKWCSEQCDKYLESSRVYSAHIDLYQCENDPYSLCMLDCQNLPATDATYCREDEKTPLEVEKKKKGKINYFIPGIPKKGQQ